MRFPPRRRRHAALALLGLSIVLLVLGLTLPAVHSEKGLSSSSHSIVGGIAQLLGEGQIVLAVIILFFSVLFPTVKLLALALVWARRVPDERETIGWLEVLGKWSMLDVFVVAIFVGAVRLGILAEFAPEAGIYVFAAAVLATMVVTRLTARIKGHAPRERAPSPAVAREWKGRVVSLAALAAFATGLSLPLMVLEKWVLWWSEKSLLEALSNLYAKDSVLLALLATLFVVVLPGASLLGMVCLRWIPGLAERALELVSRIGEWAMLDVFAVALLVVVSQLAGMASIQPRAGLWLLVAAALLSTLDGWLLRRTTRPRQAADR